MLLLGRPGGGKSYVLLCMSTLTRMVAGVREGHASAVLAASIFHFGQHTIAEAQAALRDAGLPARHPEPYASAGG